MVSFLQALNQLRSCLSIRSFMLSKRNRLNRCLIQCHACARLRMRYESGELCQAAAMDLHPPSSKPCKENMLPAVWMLSFISPCSDI